MDGTLDEVLYLGTRLPRLYPCRAGPQKQNVLPRFVKSTWAAGGAVIKPWSPNGGGRAAKSETRRNSIAQDCEANSCPQCQNYVSILPRCILPFASRVRASPLWLVVAMRDARHVVATLLDP